MRIYAKEDVLLNHPELNESGTPLDIRSQPYPGTCEYPSILIGDETTSYLTDFPKGGIVSISSRMQPVIKDFASNQVICVGLSDQKKKDRTYLLQNRINTFSMKEISFTDKREVCDSLMAAARQWEALLIHINLDVLDSSVIASAPPGGMTTRELIYFLQRLRILKNFKLAQVIPDKNEAVLAKIIAELS